MESCVDYLVSQDEHSRMVQRERFTSVIPVVHHGDQIMSKLFVVGVFKVDSSFFQKSEILFRQQYVAMLTRLRISFRFLRSLWARNIPFIQPEYKVRAVSKGNVSIWLWRDKMSQLSAWFKYNGFTRRKEFGLVLPIVIQFYLDDKWTVYFRYDASYSFRVKCDRV